MNTIPKYVVVPATGTHEHRHALPQTGGKNTIVTVIIGTLSTLIASFGLFGVINKKH